ncbi:MAG: GatB/YqeY domain-containing protein [Proteobacteria bacterium]|nr:GatB/YqeY domain-containing protein [Pseudomonadota bacterium]
MGTLHDKLESDFLTAYKAKEEVRVSVLRMLKTAIKNRQIELRAEPSDDEVLDLISRQLKQRKESIEQFRAANREDLAVKEEVELIILQEYMPEALSSEAVKALVDVTIAELGADGIKDMGRVMGAITSAYKGRVDGKELSALVRSKLAG